VCGANWTTGAAPEAPGIATGSDGRSPERADFTRSARARLASPPAVRHAEVHWNTLEWTGAWLLIVGHACYSAPARRQVDFHPGKKSARWLRALAFRAVVQETRMRACFAAMRVVHSSAEIAVTETTGSSSPFDHACWRRLQWL
jgi:hypothetical protein